MHILITAATAAELLPAREVWEACRNQPGHTLHIHPAETGIGSTATAYHTLKALANMPEKTCDLAINIGIAGSFCRSLPTGAVVRVASDYFGDCGMQTASGFQSLFDARLIDADTFPFKTGKLTPDALAPEWEFALAAIPAVDGVTVQHIVEAGLSASGPAPAGIETMEGAAFFYVCMHERIPCIALRAVSNTVGEQDKSAWDIPLALLNLKKAIARILSRP